MKENLMETFKQGLFLGMLLFICSLTALRLAAPEGVGPVWSLFPAVLSGYLAAGCFLQLIRSLAARLDSAFFRGAAAAAWCYIVLFCLFFPAQNLPLPVRIMLLTSAAVLLLLWEAEYRYLKSVARDLNSGAAGRILLIDLDEKPGSSEEFFAALETYCKKSSITLEYVKRDIPATVKLNGRLHTLTLTESYMYGGPGWSMEIQEIL